MPGQTNDPAPGDVGSGTKQATASDGRSRELVLRVVSSLVILPPIIVLFWLGELYFLALVALLAAAMAWEWCTLVSPDSSSTIRRLAGLTAAVLVGVAAFSFQQPEVLLLLGVLPLVYAATVRILTGVWILKLLPGLLVAFCPAFAIYWIREMPDLGLETALWLALSVVVTDVAAYAAGRTIGGLKIWPRVSPNKTWAGLIGGMAGSGCFGALLALYIGQAPWLVVIAGAVIAIIAQAGDFAESALKRYFDVKDSGRLIPGHGGILDRVDGQVTVLPLAAALMLLSGKSILLWTWP
ncbi:phosphatidate cytidylyltransferase [Nisaea sp.]|uniref:phosphatidate cytidylyltransferase n=1 Tax=Nisaea sp. TaxID=2024842 RepID=UPI003262FD07